MAVQEISSINDLKIAIENLAISDSYIDSNLSIGSTVYYDEAKTLLVGQKAALGIIKGKKLYSVQTDSNSKIADVQPIKEKLLGFQQGFVDENQDNKEIEINQMVAAGIPFYQFNVSFDKVYKSKAEWDANSNSIWEKYDRIYNYIKTRFSSFGVRIGCIEDDTNFYINRSNVFHSSVADVNFRYAPTITLDGIDGTPPPAFYADSDMVMDQFGMPIRAKSGWGRPTMFKESARLLMVEFVKRVIQRYPDIFSKALWLSTPTTSDHEMGLEYIQSWTGTTFSSGSHREGYYVIVDYHPLSQAYFKEVFLPRNYGNIQALNKRWGTDYAGFSNVEIPKILNVSNVTQTDYGSLYAITHSNAYLDWRRHNVEGLEVFWKECSAIIKQYASNVEYMYEVGSSTDKDTIFRGTENLIKVRTVFSSIKAQFENYSWGGGSQSVSTAIIRKNWNTGVGDIYVEVNSNDVPTQSSINETGAVKTAMLETAKQAYKNGAKIVILICTNESNPRIQSNGVFGVNQFPKTLELVKELNDWLNTGQAFEGIKTTNTITQKLSFRAKNWDAANEQWLAAGGINCSIILIDDLATSDITLPPPADFYQLNNDAAHTEIQFYIPTNLAKVEILEETYAYTDNESYEYHHVTHSVAQHQNIQNALKTAMCNLIVRGKFSGKIYARTTQGIGTLTKNAIRDDMTIHASMTGTTIKAGNNHPRKEDIQSLYRDMKVKIKPDEELIFRWENVGTASVEISLIAPDSPDSYPNLKFLEQCLAPNTNFEYTFNPNRIELAGQPRWKRAIKSNMNAMLSCNP